MKITEIVEEERGTSAGVVNSIVTIDAMRVLVGAGARILFYPTLLYNVFRNKVQAEFRWWDEIDQFLFLGAVPFPTDVPRLKQLGVGGVITLNEPYETLVRSSLYHEHGIDHLAIPTRDYLFAPSLVDISRAVDFIYKNALHGRITYVHCKAGRGCSTTIVLCYLVQYKNMTPMAALEYVRSRRPRVLLASSQWQAVQEYSKHQSESPPIKSVPAPPVSSPWNDVVQEYAKHQSEFPPIKSVPAPPVSSPGNDVVQEYAKHQSEFPPIKSVRSPPVSSPGNDVVLITEADLEGYNGTDNDIGIIPLKHPNTSSSPLSSQRVPRNSKMIAKLSCFFSTWKVSTRWSSLPEIHAC